MRIDPAKCVGCGACQAFCTMGAIAFTAGAVQGRRVVSIVDEDECVDCGVCERSGICPVDALRQPPTGWPRSVRGTFSNPLAEHKETRVPGRGTEEMKTNDVTGRYRPGYVGLGVEMGRPGCGAYLCEVEKITRPLRAIGVSFEPKNPLTSLLLPDGSVNPEVRGEKVLSCIVEFVVPRQRLPEVLTCLATATATLATVCSVDLVELAQPGAEPAADIARRAGERPYPNGKINVGLGRPRFAEEGRA